MSILIKELELGIDRIRLAKGGNLPLYKVMVEFMYQAPRMMKSFDLPNTGDSGPSETFHQFGRYAYL